MAGKKTILSLQGWRAIMMFIVVMAHVFGIKIIYGGAGEAMSFFFVLSGFVLTLAFGERIQTCNLKEISMFVKKRLAKIYPLYIVMLFVAFVMYVGFAFIDGNIEQIISYLKYLAVDSFLVQAWIPVKDYYMSLNGVSWFLSALMFSYVMFIPTNVLLKKMKSKFSKSVFVLLIICFIILTVYEGICKNVSGGVPEYYTYVFPIYRFIEFVIGMLISELFKTKDIDNANKTKFGIIEILVIMYFICEQLIFNYTDLGDKTFGLLPVIQLVVMCVLIYIFAYEKGVISKIISNKLFLWFASISFEVYLIHQVLQNAFGSLFSKLGFYQFTGIVTVIVTIIVAILWKRFLKIIDKKKDNRG